MTKIIKYKNPDISQYEYTQMTADKALGTTVLIVQNTTGFVTDNFIVIEQVGNEYAEMQQIDSIDTISQMTLKSGIQHSHGQITPVRLTLFNQMRLYRSTDNVTYSLIDTQDINWQDKFNQATFIDATGNDNYYYKVEYYNSVTTLSVMSSAIKTPTQIGYLTVEDFKKETGIKGDDDTIAHALKFGSQEIIRKLFTGRQYKTTEINNQFYLPTGLSGSGDGSTCFPSGLEFADSNTDGLINKDDFLVYEEDNTGVRTYITSEITNVDVDRHLIEFSIQHPVPNKTLVFEYQLTYRKIADLDEALRRLNMLYAVNYVFRNIPFKRLQRGCGGWTINGVSVDFQNSMISDVIKSNETEILHIISMIGRVYTRFTQLRQPTVFGSQWIKSTLNWR